MGVEGYEVIIYYHSFILFILLDNEFDFKFKFYPFLTKKFDVFFSLVVVFLFEKLANKSIIYLSIYNI